MPFIARFVCLFIHLTLVAPQFLRVACRVGHAPYSYWNNETNSCGGASNEIFQIIAANANFSFNVTPWYLDSIDGLDSLQFDATISLTSVTPSRLQNVQFSLPYTQLEYVFVVSETFAQKTRSFPSVLTARSVIFVITVILFFTFVFGCSLLLFENLHPNSELHGIHNRGKRMLRCLESAIDYGTEPPLSNEFSRSARSIFLLIMMFLITVFGSGITSNLTAMNVLTPPLRLEHLRGTTIAYQNDQLGSVFAQLGIGGQLLPNVEVAVAKWFDKSNSPQIDGFCTTTTEALFLTSKYGQTHASRGYTISDPFTATGDPDTKAFAFSFNVPPNVVNQFNVELQRIKENGEVVEILNKYVQNLPSNPLYTVVVGNDDRLAFTIVVSSLYGIYLFSCAVLWVKYIIKRSYSTHLEKNDHENRINHEPAKASQSSSLPASPANEPYDGLSPHWATQENELRVSGQLLLWSTEDQPIKTDIVYVSSHSMSKVLSLILQHPCTSLEVKQAVEHYHNSKKN